MLRSNLIPADGARLKRTGAIVICHVDDNHKGGSPALGHRYRRLMVESFHWGRLKHCATVRALDNGERFTIAAHHLEIIG